MADNKTMEKKDRLLPYVKTETVNQLRVEVENIKNRYYGGFVRENLDRIDEDNPYIGEIISKALKQDDYDTYGLEAVIVLYSALKRSGDLPKVSKKVVRNVYKEITSQKNYKIFFRNVKISVYVSNPQLSKMFDIYEGGNNLYLALHVYRLLESQASLNKKIRNQKRKKTTEKDYFEGNIEDQLRTASVLEDYELAKKIKKKHNKQKKQQS